MSKKTFFVTGTDTNVGKTQIAAGLLHLANSQGLSTLGLKPVAAGGEKTEQGLRNQDALLLQAVSSIKLPYEQINPVTLLEPVSPHIAAQQEKRVLSADRLAGFCRGSFHMANLLWWKALVVGEYQLILRKLWLIWSRYYKRRLFWWWECAWVA
jgi:dethiobiotin synthetase